MENKEIWKDVVGYEGLYMISNYGRLKSLPKMVGRGKRYLSKERIVSLHKSPNGYLRTHLDKDGERKFYSIHRLVAQTFLDNPNNYPCVNHKNENPADNRLDNLEWCTHAYNSNYGTRNQRLSKSRMGHKVSKETREKLSRINKGELHPMYGKKRSPETCKKISEGIKRYYANRID